MSSDVNEAHELRELVLAMQTEQSKMQAEISALKGKLAQSAVPAPLVVAPVQVSVEEPQVRSRRDLLTQAGLGAAATGAGVVAMSQPAAAADGAPIILGGINNSETATLLSGPGSSVTGNTFTFEDVHKYGSISDFPATLAGYATDGRSGLYGFAESSSGSSKSGHSVVASAAFDARSNLCFHGTLGDPRSSSLLHRKGEVVYHALTSSLWYCIATGTPGAWQRIASAAAAGAMHAIEPKRVWDSRYQGGPMTNGESRTISVADGRVLASAAVDVPNVVSEGATAVAINITIVNTGAAGYLAATPGGASGFNATAINWSSANLILNNGTMSTLNDDRELTIWCSGTTDFIIDVTGYYL